MRKCLHVWFKTTIINKSKKTAQEIEKNGITRL